MKKNLSRAKNRLWKTALGLVLHEIVDERSDKVELEKKR